MRKRRVHIIVCVTAFALLATVVVVAYSYWPERTNLTLSDWKRLSSSFSSRPKTIQEAIDILGEPPRFVRDYDNGSTEYEWRVRGGIVVARFPCGEPMNMSGSNPDMPWSEKIKFFWKNGKFPSDPRPPARKFEAKP